MQSARESGRVVRLGTSGTHLVRRRHATLCSQSAGVCPQPTVGFPREGREAQDGHRLRQKGPGLGAGSLLCPKSMRMRT